MRLPRFCAVAALLASCGPGLGSSGVRSASAEAQAIAGKLAWQFAPVAKQAIEPGTEPPGLEVPIEEGSCYRFIAVRAGEPAEGTEAVSVTFKHPEQVVEVGTDFIELSAGDGDGRKVSVVWGMCAWPGLAGTLSVYTNLGGTGGYLLVLSAGAKKLSWKDGKDVRTYMKAQGADLTQAEREDVESKLDGVLADQASSLPPAIAGKPPFHKDIAGTAEKGWSYHMAVAPSSCYHVLVYSPGCIMKYQVAASGGGKVIDEDGAPDTIGRNGWSRTFCSAEKKSIVEADLSLKLEMKTDEYDQCWVGLAIWTWDATAEEIKALKAKDKKAGAAVEGKVGKCDASLKKCEKSCKKGGQGGCAYACSKGYSDCTSAISFPGEIQ